MRASWPNTATMPRSPIRNSSLNSSPCIILPTTRGGLLPTLLNLAWFHDYLVYVAPDPVLARLEGLDERVLRGLEVFGCRVHGGEPLPEVLARDGAVGREVYQGAPALLELSQAPLPARDVALHTLGAAPLALHVLLGAAPDLLGA